MALVPLEPQPPENEDVREYDLNFDVIQKYVRLLIKKIPFLLMIAALIVPTITSYILFKDKLKLETEVSTTFADLKTEVNKLQAGISQNDIRRWNIMGVHKWIKETNTKLSIATCYSYATIIVDEAERQKVDVALIASIAAQESHYIYDAESWANAVGLMGIMPETGMWIAKELGVTYNEKILKEPEMNIRMGTWFLSYLMRKYDNDEKLVTAHYNGGNTQRNKYVLRQTYKNTDEYKLSIPELEEKLNIIRTELIAFGKLKEEFREDVKYKYIEDVYLGKTLAKETERYIPEVLTRMEQIKKFLSNSAYLNSES